MPFPHFPTKHPDVRGVSRFMGVGVWIEPYSIASVEFLGGFSLKISCKL